MNLNKAIIVGRVAAEPETRTAPSGQMVTSFRVATNRVWNDRATGQKREQVEFHSIVAWGALADIVQKYVAKGQLIEIEGRLQTRSWQGNDGIKRYRTEIIAENIQLGPKAGSAPSSTGIDTIPAGDTSTKIKEKEEDDIPIINEDMPTSSPSDEPEEEQNNNGVKNPDNSGKEDGKEKNIEESEVNLKDIPF